MISVFTPTRNRRDWIRRCQRSVLAQTFEDWEHVVYDVGEPDQIVADLLADDPRVRYFRGDCKGPAADFQAALELTRGEIVTPLSDDDRLPTHALQIANDLLAAHADSAWLNGRTVIHNQQGEPLHLRGGVWDHIRDTRHGTFMLGGAVYWRRSLTDQVGGFDSEFTGAADVDLYQRFLQHSEPVVSRDVLYLYTDHEKTDSRVNARRQADATRRAAERSRR